MRQPHLGVYRRSVAGKGLAIKSVTPSARLLRNFMKVAAGTSRFDELRAATIHHPPAEVEGVSRQADFGIDYRFRRSEAASRLPARHEEPATKCLR
jgi:hypothetical protein